MDIYTTIQINSATCRVVNLPKLLGERLDRLPIVLRLLAENHLRSTDGADYELLLEALDCWLSGSPIDFEFTFQPNRLLMHDTTCTPTLADIAGLKDVLDEAGIAPEVLNPVLPVEVSVDHSIAVDAYARGDALDRNSATEIQRNGERYKFMKWASGSMSNLHVNPPGTGIMHTINLEQLASVLVVDSTEFGETVAHPDMMLGTDSHTPMVNGIGVLAWGIGGLEAGAIMFGQSVAIRLPDVVGVRLTGEMPHGVLATDLALMVTSRLRKLGVAGSFVEFFGPGVSTLTADDRAVVANMAPEYGSTTGFFPVDEHTVAYLERTGRAPALTSAVPEVLQMLGVWFDPDALPSYNREITIDLSSLNPVLAGPRRPQDLIPVRDSRSSIESLLSRSLATPVTEDGVPDGAVGVAAITSCTNTSNPRLLIAAGLVARKARARGLRAKHWVKTSLAPGSPSARDYLSRSGLLEDLAAVGFDIVGFGCTTCIGNSGPLPPSIGRALLDGKAVVAVLSGNRNFPGRVHPHLNLGYLASPPLVVAYALRGDINADILTTAIADDAKGNPVYLAELWPSADEVEAAMKTGFVTEDIHRAFQRAALNPTWAALEAPQSGCFPWNPKSRYLRRPKFASLDETSKLVDYSAAPLIVLGDDITTDHISPAGAIDAGSDAGKWLIERGADPSDLNVFAAYRGNWEVMLRGLFTNRLVHNYLAGKLSPSHTIVTSSNEPMLLRDAADHYRAAGVSTVILAGERYGMGSSRDWAAKGAALLGVRAVIARSFERIHRSNLIGMGVLPIRIIDDFSPANVGITPQDRFTIRTSMESLKPQMKLSIEWVSAAGDSHTVAACAEVETRQELKILIAGGILPHILSKHISRKHV